MTHLHEIQDILDRYGTEFNEKENLPPYKLKVLNDLEHCRTSYFGGHVDVCNECGHIEISYNSCRNRHCPKCQSLKKEEWIQRCNRDLLPVKYFHVVFTLPHHLNGLTLNNQELLYSLLFKSASSVIKAFAKDVKYLGAQTAMITILHTWGQNLKFHPHLHCIIPAGGIDENGNWKHTRSNGKFLFPVKAMSKVFRAKFVAGLRKLAKNQQIDLHKELTDKLFEKDWVVYAKQPFKNVHSVIEYLGRYTHRVAISNARIISIEDGKVTFWVKNYRKNGQKEQLTLSSSDFLHRFCLHILPKMFRKIRYYGFLSSGIKKKSLAKIRKSLNVIAQEIKSIDWKSILIEKYGIEYDLCPCCKKGKMKTIQNIPERRKYNVRE